VWTVAAGGLLVLSLFGLAADLILRMVVLGRGQHLPSQEGLLVLASTGGFEALFLLLHVPLVASYAWWRSETRRVLYLFDRPTSLARNPAIIAFWVLLVVGGVLQVSSGTLVEPGLEQYSDPLPSRTTYALTADQHAAAMGLRVFAGALLVAGVWMAWWRIVHSSAAPALVAPAAPAALARPTAGAPLPQADEAFWGRIAAATPVPLLVGSPDSAPQWRLVTAGNLPALRTELPPGASLVAFLDAGTLEPARADEYHGLLQSSTDAAPAYRLPGDRPDRPQSPDCARPRATLTRHATVGRRNANGPRQPAESARRATFFRGRQASATRPLDLSQADVMGWPGHCGSGRRRFTSAPSRAGHGEWL
jgi:hypothetical protein